MLHIRNQKKQWVWCLGLCCLLSMQTGCIRAIYEKGYKLQAIELKEIKVGKDTKATVIKRLGQPSTTSIFNTSGEERWYYTFRTIEETPLKGKRPLVHLSLMITFDARGFVKSRAFLQGEQKVPMSNLITKEKGYDTTIWQETFRNIGKFGQSGGRHA